MSEYLRLVRQTKRQPVLHRPAQHDDRLTIERVRQQLFLKNARKRPRQTLQLVTLMKSKHCTPLYSPRTYQYTATIGQMMSQPVP